MKKIYITLFLCFLGWMLHAQEVDVFLIAGQSNATGQGRVSNLPASFIPDKEVMIYYSRYINKGEGSMQWQPLCPAAESKDRFGVELSMGNALHKAYPSRKIALVKHGLSGSNLYAQWNPGEADGQGQGPEYKKFIETYKGAIQALRDQGYTPVVRAIVWQQGEADARDLAGDVNNRSYGQNLRRFIHRVRQDVGNDTLPFVYGSVIPLAAARFTGREQIRKAQQDIATVSQSSLSVPGAILVGADDLQMLRSDFRTPDSNDDVHLGTFGLLTLGERFAKAIVKALGE